MFYFSTHSQQYIEYVALRNLSCDGMSFFICGQSSDAIKKNTAPWFIICAQWFINMRIHFLQD